MINKMMRSVIIFTLFISFPVFSYGKCPKVPVKDLSHELRSEIQVKEYVQSGFFKNQCFYFRDVVFKNGHGQQALVVASKHGACLGFFRIPLADSVDLQGSTLNIKSVEGEIYKMDLSHGLPKVFFFDGDNYDFENCGENRAA